MNIPKPYKTLFTGILRQKTAFSIGGNTPHGDVDSPLALDGKGEPVIRGTGLAGALIAQARRLFLEIPANITEGSPGRQPKRRPNDPKMHESVWTFHHAHLIDEQYVTEIRDGVGIRHNTGAAAKGLKFDVEIIPAGAQWRFLLEVEDYLDTPCYSAASIAAHSLAHWQKLALLGRDVARGLGWMALEHAQVVLLSADQATLWPDSTRDPHEKLAELLDDPEKHNAGIQMMTLQGYLDSRAHAPPDKACFDTAGNMEIHVQPDQSNGGEAWGLEMLSIGNSGKTDNTDFWQAARTRMIKPYGQHGYASPGDENFDPDMAIAWSRVNGEIQPIIPGSSIRGVLRSVLSALARRRGEEVWDPNSNMTVKEDGAFILMSFGHTARSARLLISDAMLIDDHWRVAVLEKHAEDELTAGAYASSKFNRAALVDGVFAFEYFIEADTQDQKEQFESLLKKAWTLGAQGFLPLGGAVNRSMGWVTWIEKNGENHG